MSNLTAVRDSIGGRPAAIVGPDEIRYHRARMEEAGDWVVAVDFLLGTIVRRGRVLATANDTPDRPERADRYVAHVVYGEAGGFFSGEEIDVYVAPGATVTQGAILAGAVAEASLEPGWAAIVMDGPIFGIYV